jgi:SAM-dependent methyltransferase
LDNPRKAESPDTFHSKEEPQPPAPELEHTGELLLPGIRGTAEIAYDHITRYRFAGRYVKGKKTIVLGSGAGYGTHYLSKFAKSVLGVDTSEEAVAQATRSYDAPNLRYKPGDVTNLPYPDESFEVAVSFEVMAHLERPAALVQEALRLLKEDGVLVVSTPDKQTYSNDRNYVNPHHLKEMYPLEFREILERHFRHVQIYRQGALAGSIVTPDSRDLPEDGQPTLESTQFSLPDPEFGREVPTTLYVIAVCKKGPDPEPLRGPHLILDRDRQIYEEFADRHGMLGPLLTMYHSHQQQVVPLQVQEQVQKQVQEILQRSRVRRLRQKIEAITAKAKDLLRRR